MKGEKGGKEGGRVTRREVEKGYDGNSNRDSVVRGEKEGRERGRVAKREAKIGR